MALVTICDIATISRRVVSALMANRLAPYSGGVGTGEGTNSRYQSDEEITDAILEIDAVIVQTRLANPGDPYRSMFMGVTESTELANNAFIPAHIGAQGNLDIKVGGQYQAAKIAPSRSEMASVIANPTLYPNADGWGLIEDSQITFQGDKGQVWVPSFIKTAECQAPQVDELAEI